jgi:hypothetical protein
MALGVRNMRTGRVVVCGFVFVAMGGVPLLFLFLFLFLFLLMLQVVAIAVSIWLGTIVFNASV